MKKDDSCLSHSQRKNEHISLSKKYYDSVSEGDFDKVKFIPNTLPEINFSQIDLNTNIGPLKLKWPIYIEAMTGGSEYAKRINAQLSRIAKKVNIPMAVGSQMIAIKNPKLNNSYSIVRKNNPKGLLFANVSANASISEAKKAIKMIQADALEIHLNATQELIMEEGDKKFKWLKNINKLIKEIKIPVIIKEVGFGMDGTSIEKLIENGAQYINIGGKGGTNFATIENFRRHKKDLYYLNDWGLTTIQSLYEAKPFSKKATFIASGGIKTPLDVVKSLYLGADAVGIAGFILNSLIKNGEQKTINLLNEWKNGIITIFTMLGVSNIKELRKRKVILSPELISYLKQRNLS